jgi:hypothetical protein
MMTIPLMIKDKVDIMVSGRCVAVNGTGGPDDRDEHVGDAGARTDKNNRDA